MRNRQQLTIRTNDGETLRGIPEACTDRVKLRNDHGIVHVPVADIEHVSRLIPLERKKDPSST
ncbi:hypothetical protein E6C60_2561 [Paenibacillus algicola]|uniref:Uncharacterized protein n=2 Tax=Paenibacillus algicola TaxID=2565926 RepID=A0A4P8XLI4_9BACL|nr:hypothetical protein E6C60_2561 [Paenibacillus algicola]